MQSFDEKDVTGSKVGSNPATGHPGSGSTEEKLANLDRDEKADTTSVEDKVEAVAAAISGDKKDSKVRQSILLNPSSPNTLPKIALMSNN